MTVINTQAQLESIQHRAKQRIKQGYAPNDIDFLLGFIEELVAERDLLQRKYKALAGAAKFVMQSFKNGGFVGFSSIDGLQWALK